MINKKIMETLAPLNLPIFYMETSTDMDKYIIFNIFREKETDRFDNKNLSEVYYITLNYWYKSPTDLGLYKQIKGLLKKEKFKFDNCSDLKEGQYFGKSMDFIYKKFV